MKKYKLLRFGQCYLNRRGEFAIAMLRGTKKKGYQLAASHVNTWLGKIQMLSRVVPNDGNWVEITPAMFTIASECHAKGRLCPPEVFGIQSL
jgi:hypothetical protein